MHLTARADVVTHLYHAGFLRRKRRANFRERPGKIIAVVLQRLVRDLAAVEAAALAIGKYGANPLDDSFGRFAEQRMARDLITMQKILQQLGIVVSHFLEVRDAPALVHGVTVESTGQLIVYAALGHTRQRALDDVQQSGVARRLITFEQQVNRTGVRKFRRAPETTVRFIEQMQRRFQDGIHYARVEFTARRVKHFGLRDSLFQRLRGTIDFRAARLERFRDAQQNALESRPAHRVFRWKIGAAEKWLSVGREECGKWPATLPGDRADRGLIARVHVGPLVAIHFYWHV